jgi:quinol monooxygenase YgiN
MHIQIINFGLEGMSEEEYRDLAGSIAPAFADLHGLISKTWLANPETNTYGGVYVWRDRRAMEHYQASHTYKAILANPSFRGVTVRDFAVLENPTRVTQGRNGSRRANGGPRVEYAPGGAAFVA